MPDVSVSAWAILGIAQAMTGRRRGRIALPSPRFTLAFFAGNMACQTEFGGMWNCDPAEPRELLQPACFHNSDPQRPWDRKRSGIHENRIFISVRYELVAVVFDGRCRRCGCQISSRPLHRLRVRPEPGRNRGDRRRGYRGRQQALYMGATGAGKRQVRLLRDRNGPGLSGAVEQAAGSFPDRQDLFRKGCQSASGVCAAVWHCK
ncbi:MAG: hypothetical protein BWZ10_03460 [candidate division BRC1 bacterium ADurb.BinA364]|nr:MAG: hypothetical protein BWZ10_03460 [candidate division BRC1 bacterium ADurb.BinA364]